MDQRSIYPFLALKRLSVRAVSNELTAVLGADAIAYSTVTKYLRQRQFTSIPVDRPEGSATIVIDQAILDALEQYPFSFIRELACFTCMPTTTDHRHLAQLLGFGVRHLCRVPHTLRLTQKTERAPLSIELVCQLRFIKHHDWQFIITLDESWFYFSPYDEHIWFRVEEQSPEKPRHTIPAPK
jgi:hypothetical protein